MVSRTQAKREMLRIGWLIADKGFVAATGGNLSVRVGKDEVIITGAGTHLGFLATRDLVAVDRGGRKLWGAVEPSSELSMHLCAYSLRPDIGAVVHAHPPLATAFSVAGVSLGEFVLPEVLFTLGSIPTSEYATPGTDEVPQAIGGLLKGHDALLMSHHGSLTLGVTLFQAYTRLEMVEHTAQVVLGAMQLGRVRLLPLEEVEKISGLREGRRLAAVHQRLASKTGQGELGGDRLGAVLSRVGGISKEELTELVRWEVREEIGRQLRGDAKTQAAKPGRARRSEQDEG